MLTRTAALCCLLIGCGASTSHSDNEVRIGLLLPYTGKDGSAGANYERGVLMAADQINAAGGLFHKPVRVIEADTHSSIERGISSAHSLIDQGVVAIIGPENDELARQLAPILDAAGIALVTPSSSSVPDVKSATDSLWFRLAPSCNDLGNAIARQMTSKGASKIAIVNTPAEYEVGFTAGVEKRLQLSGQHSVASVVIGTDNSNFTDSIQKISALQPDAIVLAADPSTASRFVNQYAIVAGLSKIQWYLSPSLEQQGFVLNSFPEVVEGMIGVAPAVIDDATQTRDFNQTFAARWEGATPTTGAYFYYDAMAVFGFAFEGAAVDSNSSSPARDVLRDRVLTISGSGIYLSWKDIAKGISESGEGSRVNYNGITGVFTFDSKTGARSAKYTRFWTITGGQFVRVAQ